MQNYLCYDCEVFIHCVIAVVKELDNGKTHVFIKRTDKNHNIVEDNTDGIYKLIKGKKLISYAGHLFDDYVLSAMVDGKSNEDIMEIKNRAFHDVFSSDKAPSFSELIYAGQINSLDCSKQLGRSYPSLNKIQANLGKSILEINVPYDLPRPLLDKEIQDVISYCTYNIDCTIEVFKLRKRNYFDIKDLLIQKSSLGNKAIRWNTTTIAAHLLTGGKPINDYGGNLNKFQDDLLYDLDKVIPKEAINLWNNYYADKDSKKEKVSLNKFGCNIEFSLGGLHGVQNSNFYKKYKFDDVIMVDVSSMYPNLILKLGVLGEASKIYSSILDKRIAVKHSDPVLSNALKLVVNSCYGLLNNKYSTLYNPTGALSVCAIGQIALYDLCRRLFECCCELININTDGLVFKSKSDVYKHICNDWEKCYNLELETEYFKSFIQKDVNNYIAIRKDGSMKLKGSDVGKYYGFDPFKNNSNRIIDICVVEKIVSNVEPLDTIIKNKNNPELFQMVFTAGKGYNIVDNYGKNYQKVNRVFAVKNGVKLYKQDIEGRKIHFHDSPTRMLVYNDSLSNFSLPQDIDWNFYYKLSKKVLSRWSVT